MSTQSRYFAYILFFAIAVASLASLKTFGWELSVQGASWLSSAAMASVPLLAIIALIYGRNRFRLSTLMLLPLLVAVFLAASVLPIHNAKQLRRGTLALTSSDANSNACVGLTTFASYPYSFSKVENPIPRWLQPIAGRQIAVPCDREIRIVALSSDMQITLFCRHAQRFTNLRELHIKGPGITNESIAELHDVAKQLGPLERIIFGDAPFDVELVNCISELSHLWIYDQGLMATKPPLDNRQLEILAKTKGLKSLCVMGYNAANVEMAILSDSKTLTSIQLLGTGVSETSARSLDASMPHCIVQTGP